MFNPFDNNDKGEETHQEVPFEEHAEGHQIVTPPPDPHNVRQDVLIKVENVSKSFGEKKVLEDISFEVKEKEVLAVIGTSGCGKSTLLRIIAGLETSDSGRITLGDPNFTMVFQYSALFDSLTVFENIAFSLLEDPDIQPAGKDGPKVKRPHYSEQELRKIVREKLKMVGLEGIEDQFPNELSGGMQKRVSFARAIVSNPRIILYDEPTAGLDPVASESLENDIIRLRDGLQAASIVVTHEFSTIFRTADKVCFLHKGRVRWMGTPQELIHTQDPEARKFAQAAILPELAGK